jgi:glycogen operon protein
LRGIDNASYYRLRKDDRSLYEDATGCGNTLDFGNAGVQRLVLDCLRYWIEQMHVDGFRFDLATVLARGDDGQPSFDGLFKRIAEDPVLGEIKLIAEPWDVGPGGYQAGAFPAGWSEWNDFYRKSVRRFWRGDVQPPGELARRLSGSDDVFRGGGRRACASINYVASHDGFTLRDLVSYEHKRNEANGQDNRDGLDDDDSCNWGREGPTNDRRVLQMRRQMQRNFLATLMLSKGVPMLSAGDELGRTQRGNNNAYCQDNEISWLDWELDDQRHQLLSFAQAMAALRRRCSILRSCDYYVGEGMCACGLKDVSWLRPDGSEMTESDWANPQQRTLGVLVHEHPTASSGGANEPVDLLAVFHAGSDDVAFRLPERAGPSQWTCRVDTAWEAGMCRRRVYKSIDIRPRSLILCESRRQ